MFDGHQDLCSSRRRRPPCGQCHLARTKKHLERLLGQKTAAAANADWMQIPSIAFDGHSTRLQQAVIVAIRQPQTERKSALYADKLVPS